jgi:hypothetical protein
LGRRRFDIRFWRDGKENIIRSVKGKTRRDQAQGQECAGVYPNSLNWHIRRMRKAKALDGLPHFSLHLVRSTMGDFIAEKVSGVVSSLVLAHTAGRRRSGPDDAAIVPHQPTMTEKAAGMKVWADALIESFLTAGGTMPEPREDRRNSKVKQKPRR